MQRTVNRFSCVIENASSGSGRTQCDLYRGGELLVGYILLLFVVGVCYGFVITSFKVRMYVCACVCVCERRQRLT